MSFTRPVPTTEILLEKIRLHVQRSVSRFDLMETKMTIDAMASFVADDLLVTMHYEIHGLLDHVVTIPAVSLTVHEKYPQDWWQALKERWFPAWAKRWWPVAWAWVDEEKYRPGQEIRIFKAVCPHLPFASQNEHIRFFTQEQQRQAADFWAEDGPSKEKKR